MKKVLVTGAAGFIGFHTSKQLLQQGYEVVGVDNLNPYYDVSLKESRLKILKDSAKFSFEACDISDHGAMLDMWNRYGGFVFVIHLAAQAGVRYSINDPFPYITSNIMGFTVILELCRHQPNFKHLVYASTSSVYGTNKDMPFTEDQRTDHPMSLYAATKKSNELMAQSYHHLFQLPVTGLRFFTVYGPWGRPDMSAFKFVKAMLADDPIDVYNHGDMARDYTFVEDTVSGIIKALESPSASDASGQHPVYNLANRTKINLLEFIQAIEEALGMEAKKNFLPLQMGDVKETVGNIDKASHFLAYMPKTSMKDGVRAFVAWYKDYYR